MRWYFLFVVCGSVCLAHAQYAPQIGLGGSTGISGSSSQFAGWATQCAVQRGFMDIANPSLGYASAGDSSLAVGPADVNTASLGDSGVAVLTFAHPIVNGPGPDFAVFENGFLNVANDSEAFLELAFVEVSSDGINYVRFPATSLTQSDVQLGNDNYINACNLDNLAGKYVATYGTPFDLQELAGAEGLDVNNVTHVRLVDAIGSIGAHASRDNSGRIINDPYPTPFLSCGFDLDAVGVINQSGTAVGIVHQNVAINVYPNPATDRLVISVKGNLSGRITATLTDIAGAVLQQCTLTDAENVMSVAQYPSGLYYLTLQYTDGTKCVEKIVKR